MSHQTPLVTIITPTYNHGPWVGACIESVRRQGFGSWEQIIVDDGSTDDTPARVAPYLEDPRIVYIRQENRGIWRLVENYQRAMYRARGSLVAVLEGDDLWPADKLERQVPAFDNSGIGLVYGRVASVDRSGQPLAADTAARNRWTPPSASFASDSSLPFLRDLLLLRGNVGAVSLMLRRSSLEAVGGFWQPSYFPAVDFTTLLRVATVARATFLDHTLGYWRQHAGQTTDIHGLRYVLGHTRAALEYYRSLPAATRDELRIGEHDIMTARRGYMAGAYWGATRAAMRMGDWVTVRRYATEVLHWGNSGQRARGLAGLVAGLLHVDLNGLLDSVPAGLVAPRT